MSGDNLDNIFKENLRLSYQEIESKKTVLLSRPRKLNIALTTACNLSCLMCEAKKINWEIPKKVIEEVSLFFPYLERIIWQGGEVFLFEPFKGILQEAACFRNLTHEITTNAHLINDEWLNILKKINLDLNVSVDAFSEELYVHIRKGSRFRDLIRFLEVFNTWRMEGGRKTLILIFTVMKSNYREIARLVEFAHQYHFDRILLQPVKGNYENQENIFYKRDIAALEYIEAIKPKIKQEARESGIQLEEWLPLFGPLKAGRVSDISSVPQEKQGQNAPNRRLFCRAPWEQLFIEWGGGVYPHCLCLEDGPNEKRLVGSVLKNSLAEIWNNHSMQAFRRKIAENDFHHLCSRDCVSGLIAENLRNLSEAPALDGNITLAPSQDLSLQEAKQHLQEKNYELAVREIKEIISCDGENTEAHFELGKAYYLKGYYSEAIKELLLVRDRRPQDAHTRLLLAKLYKTTGDYESAIEEIKQGMRIPLLQEEAKKELSDIYPFYLRQIKDLNIRGEHEKALEKISGISGLIPENDAFGRNILLSEQEIAQKKLVVSAKMRNLIITLSTACNLNCVMCEERRLKWDIPQRMLEEVKSYFPYLERIVWQGGEAFVIDYFDQLLEEAAGFPQMQQVITTNGLLIDEARAERLVRRNVNITFSIDGINKEIYEKVRQGASFKKLMRNLKAFNAARRKYNNRLLNTNLHMVVMKSNYRQLEDYIDFAKEQEFRLLAFLPIGGNFNNPENIFFLQDKEALDFIEDAMPGIEEKARRYGVLLENRLPMRDKMSKAGDAEAQEGLKCEPGNKMLCHLPWLQIYLDYDGTIRPDCVCRPEKSIGNAASDTLAQVWNNERMQEYRRMIIDNNCAGICNMECVRGQVSERYLKFA